MITCPACNQPTIPDLSKTERQMLVRLDQVAPLPLTREQIMAGLSIDISSFSPLLTKLKRKLRAHGLAIVNDDRGRGHRSAYRLERVEEGQ